MNAGVWLLPCGSQKCTCISAMYEQSINHWLPAATTDTPATSRKHPAFSPLNNEARQPTTRVGSISLSRVLRSAAPPPTKKRRPRCHYKFTHYTGYFSPNIRPRQLHWDDWAIGTAIQAYAHCTLLSGVQGNLLISIPYLCYYTPYLKTTATVTCPLYRGLARTS